MADEKKEKSDSDFLGHTTGGEMRDHAGNIDSTQSAKPVPRDAQKVDIPASAQVGGSESPPVDDMKLEEDEDAEGDDEPDLEDDEEDE